MFVAFNNQTFIEYLPHGTSEFVPLCGPAGVRRDVFDCRQRTSLLQDTQESAGSERPPATSGTGSPRDAAVNWLSGRINYERTLEIPYGEGQLKLDRMRELLGRLGRPDARMKIVHVAGTKGKGSTSAMIAGVLAAAGFRTGLFTSPHLERIEERFAVDGEPCSAEELVTLVERVRPVVEGMDARGREKTDQDGPCAGRAEQGERGQSFLRAEQGTDPGGPTFFEIVTAIALVHFVERRVDAAVLEVGLGGRLDSTNACLPAVSVITSISFDHTKQLGNTLAAIAREKAGIIKPGVPVVCGVTDAEPQAVIADIARQHGCRLIQLGVDFEVQYHSPCLTRQEDSETRRQGRENPNSQISLPPCLPVCFTGAIFDLCGAIDFQYAVAGQEVQIDSLPLAMHGRHQAANAALALATTLELRNQGWCISSAAMRAGLAMTAVPARIELFRLAKSLPQSSPSERGQDENAANVGNREISVVVDVAHNGASARSLVEALAELPQPSRRTLVLSVSRDKDIRAIVGELVPHFDRIVVTQYRENPRAVAVDELAGIVKDLWAASETPISRPVSIEILSNPAAAWQHAHDTAQPTELICITGSFFLAAELRPLVMGALRVP